MRSFLNRLELNGDKTAMDIHKIAMSTAHINVDLLLCGETGTGKDTLAKCVHELSDRTGSFVGINCAAIPEALAESQLFGVVSGAYTGVSRSRIGYIEAAQGGTLYLDEIDSMPPVLQAKLLRILETRGIERLGSTTFVPLDFRVIASAQRPLGELVEQGLFRRDLFFRLNVLTIQLPALRKRREHILSLFDQFIHVAAAHYERPVPEMDSHLMQILLSHHWSGNIRELKSAATRYVLGFPILSTCLIEARDPGRGLKGRLKMIEKMLITDALKRHEHSLDAVGEELNLPKRTLYHRMKELGV